jgi:hypothetical protein
MPVCNGKMDSVGMAANTWSSKADDAPATANVAEKLSG